MSDFDWLETADIYIKQEKERELVSDYQSSPVERAVRDGVLVAWDGCHKLYVAMDEKTAQWFRDEYPHVEDGSEEAMLGALHYWWAKSCELRFIQSVWNIGTYDEDYDDIIEQFSHENPF